MKAVLLKLFAVATSYMILSFPLAFATTIHIFYQGGFELTVPLPGLVDGLNQGQISFQQDNPPFGDYNMIMSLSNNTPQQLQTLYLFRCQLLDPSPCVNSVTPDSYSFVNGELDLFIPWSTIRDQPGIPEFGNLLIVIKSVNAYGGSWVASWHEIVRTTQSNFIHTTSDISDINVDVPTIEEREVVKNFVEDYSMLPMTNINTVTFLGVSSLHQLSSSSPPTFSGSQIASNQISSIPADFAIALPSNSLIQNGITLTQNPSNYLCGGDFDGDGNMCDAGETSSNCCFDCGCPGGQYCDLDQGCSSSSTITLEVIPPTNTQLTNCNQENTVTVTVRLNNPPSDLVVTSQSYILNSTQQFPLSCSPSGNIYTCLITVPADPNCDEGNFIHTQNSITFDITYSDGPNQVQDSLTTPFPDITVGSWTCGDGVCDAELGETSLNCCFDCGCSEGQYCDIVSGADPDTGVCSQQLSNSNLFVSNITPTSFPIYNPSGNTVTFLYQITSPPQSLSIGQETCLNICISPPDQCTAPCSISCTQPSSNEGDCSLIFTINDYDQLKGYVVTPEITVPVSYNDGPFLITDSLTRTLPPYEFGPFFCGDLACNEPYESPANCCFDCGCTEGKFCNTVTVDAASLEDICALENMQLVIDKTSNTSFVDQTLIHSFNVTAHIENIPPHGISLYGTPYSCSLDEGNVTCTLQCTPRASEDPSKFPFVCEIFIPELSDPENEVITLSPNTLNVTVNFNNQTVVASKQLSAELEDITITQTYHCGLDSCESFLGETAVNCCIDCPCSEDPAFGSEYICIPGGGNVNSICLAQSEITAQLISIEPQPLECDILPPVGGGGCIFTESLIFTFEITNPPSSLQLLDANHAYEGETTSASCVLTEATIQCFFQVPPLEDDSPGDGFSSITPGEEQRDISFIFEVSYVDNFNALTQTLVTPAPFTIFKDDEQIQSCQKERDRLDSKIEKSEKNKNIVLAILSVVWGFVTIEFVRCAICEAQEPSHSSCAAIFKFIDPLTCTEKWKLLQVGGCLSALLLPFYQKAETAMEQQKIERDAVCQAPDAASLKNSVSGFGDTTFLVLEGAAVLVCLVGGNFGPGAEEAVTEGVQFTVPSDYSGTITIEQGAQPGFDVLPGGYPAT